jgi:hypothetical protein
VTRRRRRELGHSYETPGDGPALVVWIGCVWPWNHTPSVCRQYRRS